MWWWEGRWQKKSNTNALFPRLLARRHHGSVEAPRDWLGTGGLQFHITNLFSCCAPIRFLLRGYPLDIFYAHPPTIIIAESNLFMSLWYIMDVYLICFLSCARMSDLKVMHIQYLLDIFYTRTPTIIIHFISFIYSLFLHTQAIYPLPFIMVHYGCLIHLI